MASLSDIIKKKSKEWDCPELMDVSASNCGRIPFSSPLMNFSTYGGLPRNKIIEFYGEYSSGKTTTAIDVCKNAVALFKSEHEQKLAELRESAAKGNKSANASIADIEEVGPKKVFYLDLEHTYDPKWAKILGLEEDSMLVMQPPDTAAEELVQMIEEMVETGELGLIVIDSVPSFVTQKELDKDYDKDLMAPLARLMTTFSRRIVPILERYSCTMILINQVRDNLLNPYVKSTPGGKALKFYSALRIEFRIGDPVDFLGNKLPKNTENPAGYLICAHIVKQKTAPHDRKQGTYYLMCQTGIRPDFDYALLAVNKYGIIQKAGAWFTICDPYTGEVMTDDTLDVPKPIKLNGLAKVYDFLNSHSEYYQKLQKFILDDINGISGEEELKGATDEISN